MGGRGVEHPAWIREGLRLTQSRVARKMVLHVYACYK
jgi:hypothetical protein